MAGANVKKDPIAAIVEEVAGDLFLEAGREALGTEPLDE